MHHVDDVAVGYCSRTHSDVDADGERSATSRVTLKHSPALGVYIYCFRIYLFRKCTRQ